MTCTPIRDEEGNVVGIACGRGAPVRRCSTPGCAGVSVALCDRPIGGDDGKTCSRRMCNAHRARAGTLDFCPAHAAAALDGWRGARLLALDTETTGPDPETARVVEIGAFFLEGAEWARGVRFGQLVNPNEPIPAEASAIHGITDAEVESAPALHEIWPRLRARIESADAIVGYNWPYDRRVLERELCDSDGFAAAIAGKPVLDALDVVRLDSVGRYWKGKGRHKLEAIAERLRIKRRGKEHRCSSDAELAMRVLFALAGEHIPRELEAASRFLAEAHETERVRFAAWQAANPEKPQP